MKTITLTTFVAFFCFLIVVVVAVAANLTTESASSTTNNTTTLYKKSEDNEARNIKSFGFSYKLFVPWNKYPWYNRLESGQDITNEVVEYFLNVNLFDCQHHHYGNHPCSWIDIFNKGPCKFNEWFQFNCSCHKDECNSIPTRILDYVENDIKTQYPWSDWLYLEWFERPEIIPNPKIEDDEDTIVLLQDNGKDEYYGITYLRG